MNEKKNMNLTMSKNGGRIDKELRNILRNYSRNRIDELISQKNVLVNQKQINKNYKVKRGDEIKITIPYPKKVSLKPENIPLDILYEDSDLLVVNKPQGMVVHPSFGHADHTLVNALLFHAPLSSINGEFRPGIVHRLDKDTSGLLVVAKNNLAHKKLAKSLKLHKTKRKYIAIVYGNFSEERGEIKAPLGRDPKNRKKQAIRADGKMAVTHFKVLKRFNNFTLLEIVLETGRTHQIRVHMAYINHPVLGDPLYGPKKKAFNKKKQYLHAFSLSFVHPRTGKELSFKTSIPLRFKKIVKIFDQPN